MKRKFKERVNNPTNINKMNNNLFLTNSQNTKLEAPRSL